MQFNYHVVAHTVDTDVVDVARKIADAVESVGHVLDRILYTDDNGTRDLSAVVKVAGDVVSAIPGAAPIVDAGEAAIEGAGKIADDVQSAESPKPGETPETPASIIEEIKTDAEALIHKL